MTTGERIRSKRKENQLTQKQLGEKIGLSGSQIALFEKGHYIPSLETVFEIASALGTSVEALTGKERPRTVIRRQLDICPVDRCVWRRDNGVGYTCGAGGCIMAKE